MENLSLSGLGPKIIVSDQKSYRAEEFVEAFDLDISQHLEDNIIQQLIRILVAYSCYSFVNSYSINSDSFSCDYDIKIKAGKNYPVQVKKNMYEMCAKSMLTKANKNFEIFSLKFKERFDKMINSKVILKFQKIKYYLENYKSIFSKIFPKEALFVLNHNDVHRLNFLMQEKDRLMLIDHEYAALNLIGIDIVNYIIEANFNYKVKEFPFLSLIKILILKKCIKSTLIT